MNFLLTCVSVAKPISWLKDVAIMAGCQGLGLVFSGFSYCCWSLFLNLPA